MARERMTMQLEGRVVVITGGAAGIGLATVQRFLEAGAFVAVCDVDRERGEQLVRDNPGRTSFDVVDVTDRAAAGAWIDAVAEAKGRIDVLINNAGIVRDGQLVKVKDGAVVGGLSESDFDRVISVNLKGTFNCAQAVVPHMIAAKSGVILNASSVVAFNGNFGQTNYVATKAGVIGFTQTWSRELGKHGIRVNAVAPGFTQTDILNAMPEKVLDGMRARTPLGRMGTPRDIANAYLFLASDDASFITGEVLRVDGGLVIGT